MERDKTARMPRTVSMANVTPAVANGNLQNSHSMVADERVSMAMNTATLLRSDFLMDILITPDQHDYQPGIIIHIDNT